MTTVSTTMTTVSTTMTEEELIRILLTATPEQANILLQRIRATTHHDHSIYYHDRGGTDTYLLTATPEQANILLQRIRATTQYGPFVALN